MTDLRRYALMAAGTLFVALGVIGIFVPVLPTTPFLLLAAAAYARSSERFYRWLLEHRLLGQYIRAYHEGRGLPRRTKAFTLALLWVTIGLSAILVVQSMWVRGGLLVVAVGVTWHLLAMPTADAG